MMCTSGASNHTTTNHKQKCTRTSADVVDSREAGDAFARVSAGLVDADAVDVRAGARRQTLVDVDAVDAAALLVARQACALVRADAVGARGVVTAATRRALVDVIARARLQAAINATFMYGCGHALSCVRATSNFS